MLPQLSTDPSFRHPSAALYHIHNPHPTNHPHLSHSLPQNAIHHHPFPIPTQSYHQHQAHQHQQTHQQTQTQTQQQPAIDSTTCVPALIPAGMDPSQVDMRNFYPYQPNEVKHRKRTTRAQLKVLESVYKYDTKPNASLRKKLAAELDMTPRGVQVWFQNRRAKTKQQLKKAEAAKRASSPSKLDDTAAPPSPSPDAEADADSPSPDDAASPLPPASDTSPSTSPLPLPSSSDSTASDATAAPGPDDVEHRSDSAPASTRRESLSLWSTASPNIGSSHQPQSTGHLAPRHRPPAYAHTYFGAEQRALQRRGFDPNARRRSVDTNAHRLGAHPYAHLAQVANMGGFPEHEQQLFSPGELDAFLSPGQQRRPSLVQRVTAPFYPQHPQQQQQRRLDITTIPVSVGVSPHTYDLAAPAPVSPLTRATSPPPPAIAQSAFAPRHSFDSGVGLGFAFPGSPVEPLPQYAFALSTRTLSAPVPGPLPSPNFSFGNPGSVGASAPGSGGASPALNARRASAVSDADTEESYAPLSRFGGQRVWARGGGRGVRLGAARELRLGTLSGDVLGMEVGSGSTPHTAHQSLADPHAAGSPPHAIHTPEEQQGGAPPEGDTYPSPASTVSAGSTHTHVHAHIPAAQAHSSSSELAFALHGGTEEPAANAGADEQAAAAAGLL
ncbi:Homeobox protein HD-10 [Grifola frondosa]|uniref:Homeobox protein HD-10 n=1 Tax=Grifola frondosa TaxID=5627 RepID=A0A1C7LTG6_GRIFR|nr:Homeobox protein HD-10 [Grifola frondosa]